MCDLKVCVAVKIEVELIMTCKHTYIHKMREELSTVKCNISMKA